ncbi:MAG: transporter, partial [Lacipirellulaceae bacterium]
MDFRRKTRFLLATLALIVASGCATTQEYVLSSSNPKSVASGREEERTKAPTEDSATPKSKIQLASQTEDISLPSLSPNDLNNEVEESSGSGQQSGEDQSASEAVEELVQPMELTLIPPVAEQQQPVDYFIQVALSGHPKIQAAQNRVSAAANVIPQARALPDPSFNNTFWPIQDQALQTAGGRVGHQFQLGQGVPWPEKLRAKAAIASREVQIAQAELNRIQR